MTSNNECLAASLTEIGDLARGYRRDEEGGSLRCLHCSAAFEVELIHPVKGGQGSAERAAKEHVAARHGGPLEALLAFGKERTGLSEIQEGLLRSFHAGLGDREVAEVLGGKSASTIRNHRFQLRRRESEAKIFVALMALLAAGENRESRPLSYAADLPAGDERIDVTAAEAAAIETRYLDWSRRPALSSLPKKQKEKLVLLRAVAERFERDRSYTENEVNAELMPVFGDYVTIRRYLIEYRFLERKPDGSDYRRR